MTDEKQLVKRPPVVVVVGHIDHGKSSLLEAIRDDFRITEKESGGITQHIGAYEVEVNGHKLTFIDTPGHEAFSAMRQRGARVADIAILVVDAAEGVKAQTKEAIQFVKQAEIPMIVAINKMDKPEAQPERVKKELSGMDVVVESWGGEVLSCNISAKTKQGIPELLEAVLLVAEMENLEVDLSRPAEGIVIESLLDNQRGPVATLMVASGILKDGDFVATNSSFGRVKCLNDFQGKKLHQAMPSQPVSVLGFEKPVKVGDCFKAFDSMEAAKLAVTSEQVTKCQNGVFHLQDGQKMFGLVLKADVLGSLEAIEGVLVKLPQDKVVLKILKSEVGDITVADVKTAEAGIGVIYGFRAKAEEAAKDYSRQRGVKIKNFDVIYDLVQEVRKDMTAILDTEVKRVELGKFKVTVIFKQGKDGQIIGGKVIEGEIEPESSIEIFRNEEKIGAGKVKTIQQEKKNVGKVLKGKEAAFLLRSDIKVELDDIIAFHKEERHKGVL
ncbi:MAG: translation initiation factor IF-2 [Candidatus Pacebacteria bacterium]|nr:translation initiation factor IF-2 [Candidatus Paceibacterota bacterium]